MKRSGLDRIVGLAFWSACVICMIDLNDLIRMWLGVERAFSVPLLFCCLVMLVGLLRVRPMDALGWPGLLMLASLLSYSGLGMLAAFVAGTEFQLDSAWYLVRHLSSAILILGTAVGGRLLLQTIGEERVLRGFTLIVVGSCVVMIASPRLVDVFLVPPPEGSYRYFGAFSDPNMAAMVACFGLVSALAFMRAGRQRVLAYGAVLTTVTALVGTFSRTALVVLPFILAWALLASRGRERVRLVGGLALIAFVAAPTVRDLALALEDRQLQRLESLVEIVEFTSVDDVSLAGRVTLWNLALEETLNAPLLGHGLGRLHRLEGAWYNDDGDLLGAHNQYLVLIGEAGFVPLMFFLSCLGLLLRIGFRRTDSHWILGAVSGWTVVVVLFSVAFHGILVQKACAFVIGLSCAAATGLSNRAEAPQPAAAASVEGA